MLDSNSFRGEFD